MNQIQRFQPIPLRMRAFDNTDTPYTDAEWTVQVYRYTDDLEREILVAETPMEALVGDASVWQYLIDGALNTDVGVLEVIYTTTDLGLIAQGLDVIRESVQVIPELSSIWNVLSSELDVSGSIGALIVARLSYLLGEQYVTFTRPVDQLTGDFQLVRGDDYLASSGRPLPTWVSDEWAAYDLTGAVSVTFRAIGDAGTIFTQPVTVVSDTELRLQLPTALTSTFPTGRFALHYDIEAILASGDTLTLARGRVEVLEDVRVSA